MTPAAQKAAKRKAKYRKLTVPEANAVARDLDARVNGYGDQALAVALSRSVAS